MGDSDDEYDRRRGRDKFRKERSDYQDRGRDDRGRRDDWVDSRRDSWSRDRTRRDYREYDPRSRRDRYSPPPRHEVSPPMKRMRRTDMREDRNYPPYELSYGASSMVGGHQNWGPPHDVGSSSVSQYGYGGPGGGQRNEQDNGPTQPPMKTFKQFLASQDDTISDEDAVKNYNEYKLEFKRQQLNDFFINHKEEEWFKSKYHPEECGKRQAEQLAGIKRRLEVFMEILDKGFLDSLTLDSDKSDLIVKLLDAVVIKLEGGTDNDLKILDQPEEPEKPEKPELSASSEKREEQPSIREKHEDVAEKPKEPSPKNEKKRKRTKEFKYDENEESGSDSDSASEEGEESADAEEPAPVAPEETASTDEAKPETSKDVEEQQSDDVKDDSSSVQEADKQPTTPQPSEENGEVKAEDEEKTPAAEEIAPEEPEIPRPRPLHKTCSIFLRNLAPTITKQEVEAMCKRYPGFLRVAIADPQPERRFFRRGWVTFERGVNIKEICWNLNNIRLRDCELGAIVNRDLVRRIRSVSGITSHKQVCKADIKTAAKIIQNLDKRYELWTEEEETKDGSIPSFGLISKNPLLKNITDYLIEEASAEEEELLGTSDSDEKQKEAEGSETTVERDETLIKVVDRLIMYLRLVHSVDYYNHSDYPNEEEMPNRCGILHARGPPPSSKVTQQEVNEYITNFEQKVTVFLQPVTKLSSEESSKLGKKDPEAEVDKFIQANTQELSKDKWLCPLSGKKFKGPEFVKKHIFNKHGEKIEEVKKEVEYFNNYLIDPKRPQLPEHPGNKPGSGGLPLAGRSDPYSVPQAGYAAAPQYAYSGYGQGSRASGPGLYTASYAARAESFRAGGSYYQKRGRFQDPRAVIGYHDLDAPVDMDLF